MTYENLRELVKLCANEYETVSTAYEKAHIEEALKALTTESESETFWQHPERVSITQKLDVLRTTASQHDSVTSSLNELNEFLELYEDGSFSEEELSQLINEAHSLKKNLATLKLSLLLTEKHDHANCYLELNAGAGGTESQDWAEMLLRMYMRFTEKQGWQCQIIDHQPGEEAGIKSATLYIKHKQAYGLLKTELGVHRLVRISPYDSNKRRHTSFASVTIIPEHPEEDIKIAPDDLKIDTYRAGGAGGQHVNKTDSAVRITHIPTGIVVQCQNERSQLQNKQTALKMLNSRLAKIQEEEREKADQAIERKKIEWGSQIRSYVLHPYKMVKDHRSNHESPTPDKVLDGDLMDFIEAALTNALEPNE
jgi:peptide chain release factor 2